MTLRTIGFGLIALSLVFSILFLLWPRKSIKRRRKLMKLARTQERKAWVEKLLATSPEAARVLIEEAVQYYNWPLYVSELSMLTDLEFFLKQGLYSKEKYLRAVQLSKRALNDAISHIRDNINAIQIG